MYNELCRPDKVLIKYMEQVKLYDEDFRILDRYRGWIEIVEEYKLSVSQRDMLRVKFFTAKELSIFDKTDNYIVSCLRLAVINGYIKKTCCRNQ